MNFCLKILPEKYRKWTSLFGGFLLSFVYGACITFSNISPYVISYIRNADMDYELRYSRSIWLNMSNTISLKIGTLLTGFIFSSKLKLKLNLKAFIFVGCILYRLWTIFASNTRILKLRN